MSAIFKLSKPRLVQLASSTISSILCTAALGVSAHSFHVYRTERETNPWWLPLWPAHFNVHGTTALIGTSASILLLNLFYLTLSFVPRFELAHRPTMAAVLGIAVSLPAGLISLCTAIYVHVLNNNAPDVDTIQTWTCRFSSSKPAITDLQVSDQMSNHLFGSLCEQSKFALYAMLVVFLLQGLLLATALVGWVVEKWAQHKSGDKSQDESSMEMGSRASAEKDGNVTVNVHSLA
ncbi:hypothetical protein H2201_008421 [Coniosporium apollinis]|uniref:MARVEL domain-containing protein n=2 Tax=Coniosporium TaxID=2810619 RepID=A0ABQ9NGY2_9PEZI|nr:hypothetical protein H2201_008421 [Coniosporium apollinis]